MDMIDILNELANSRVALDHAKNDIFKLKGKCFRKNLAIAGLMWVTYSACKMLGESEEKRKKAEERAREAEALCAKMSADDRVKGVCCDGKASIDKKEV